VHLSARIPSRASLFATAAAIACSLALGLAPAAGAANVVYNPGFEQGPCPNASLVLCGWTNSVGTAITQDTTTHHGGAASMGMSSAGTAASAMTTTQQGCRHIAVGTYGASFWYRTGGQLISLMELSADFYPSSDCTGAPSTDSFGTTTLIVDQQWHEVTGDLTAPAGTGSVRFRVSMSQCANCFGIEAGFDDIVVDDPNLAVTMASFKAVRSRKSVVVRWRTGTEYDQLGFNVYRQQGNRRVRLNRRVLPALGRVNGGSYSFRDRRAPKHRALRYWLQDVDLSGTRTWHGPIRVAAA
jgi:hypothetical protein